MGPLKAVPQQAGCDPHMGSSVLEGNHHGFTETGMGRSRTIATSPSAHTNNGGVLKNKFKSCLVCFQMAIYPFLCDWDIYGFRIGSGPFGSRQCIER